MSDRKMVLYLSKDIPHSIADFYETLNELNNAKIHTTYINRANREFITEHGVVVCFRSVNQNLDGFRLDEIFGCFDPKWDLIHLKCQTKPRFSGTLVEYIIKIEENAKTNAFLESELKKLRGGVSV